MTLTVFEVFRTLAAICTGLLTFGVNSARFHLGWAAATLILVAFILR